jgi:arylsulfatase A-like enzyme
MIRCAALWILLHAWAIGVAIAAPSAPRPNILFILVDDLGYGDFGCYGNKDCATPNVDRLAAEGIRFTQFYDAAPVCSASRTAFTTGQFPARHRIQSFLASREENRRRGMADFLDPRSPSVARALQAAGYATGHFGKWHLGGGRDVADAPLPAAYGFDESFTSFEGLGDRVLIRGDNLSEQSAKLGQGNIQWAAKHELGDIYVDHVVDFLRRRRQSPCYVQLWLNDVHDPFAPAPEQLARFQKYSANPYVQQYFAVLEGVDAQIGRLMAELAKLGLDDNTLVILASDNGPTAWPRYDRAGFDAPGSTAGLRGRKWSLYDGGVRSPLIVRWKGAAPAGRVDQHSVIGGVDFLPTLCKLAGADAPAAPLDGVDMSAAFRGATQQRKAPLFWSLNRCEGEVQPARPIDRSPPLAIRDAQWKLLANADGSQPELYDKRRERPEFENVAGLHPDVVDDLSSKLLAWAKTLPPPLPGAAPVAPDVGRRLLTRFAADLDPAAPLPEYPRPQMARPRWLNLNGRWQYAIRPQADPQPKHWDGRMVVPFPAESLLSDVKKRVGPRRTLWYRRTFEIPSRWKFKHLNLNFGAVDWRTRVWVNGREVGAHEGGYDPFTFDIAAAVKQQGPQELVVAVWDPTNRGPQPRGKQTQPPHGIWYTPVTGIWQTVWLEPLPDSYISGLKLVPGSDGHSLAANVTTVGAADAHELALHVTEVQSAKAREQLNIQPVTAKVGGQLSFHAPAPVRRWSPLEPWLYSGSIELRDRATGRVLDRVNSYFALRSIERRKDPHGVDRLFLNGKPTFMFAPLDQGWWPDGLYTAPTDAALAFDIEQTRRLGFNAIRKYVKVEPDRWYYWADRLGVLVWQDMPSAMQSGGKRENQVPRNGADLNLPENAKTIFRRELQAMIDAVGNHPSIIAWVPFNEGWGQHDTNEILKWVQKYDPTRLVDGPSGWTDRHFGDMLDMHSYPGPDMPPVTADRASVLGEFGGLGLPVRGHTWVSKDNWGYRSYNSPAQLQSAYEDVCKKLPALIRRGLAAAVYTQTTDVEIEVNGLMTYDRALIKMDAETVGALNRSVVATPLDAGAPPPAAK